MNQPAPASEQATPEQIRARIIGEKCAVWNDLRRRIEGATTLAEMRGVEESLDLWEYGDDLKLNALFEDRWRRIEARDRTG